MNVAKSFENLDAWRDQFLLEVGNEDDFPFVVIGNKTDLTGRVVTQKQALEWCKSKGGIPYFETSAQDATNIDKAFATIARVALRQSYKDWNSDDFPKIDEEKVDINLPAPEGANSSSCSC